ncbi:MAG: hypothetical protein KJ901_23620 [Gammaproteobacteria bacterium]|nr:hypothetical protein [Gammaproteobacteria bacterium]
MNDPKSRLRLAGLAAALLVASTHPAQSAVTDLSTVPVAGVGQAAPKPNIMLLMDTSRSMAFTHMPDELEGQQYVLPVGYRSAQCNSIYYDPNKVYGLPKNADGAYLPTPMFTSARYNAYSSADLSTTDLSARFRAFDKTTRQTFDDSANDKEQPAYYYQFVPSSDATPPPNYKTAPCTDLESNLFPNADFSQSTLSANTTGGTWKRKLVTAASGPGATDERRNFAIWYTYYRTRMAMVKSSVSLAFSPLTEKFRIGLVSVNPLNDPSNADSGVAASKYLAIDDFATTQKNAWYGKLFAQAPEGSSPAREGLARVGRHYAGKTDGINRDMTPDPVKNSCQQNFTIMTTDGYWNTAQETRGPVGLDGVTKVGQRDGLLTPKTSLDGTDASQYSHRPIWDGSTSGTRTDVNRYEQSRYQPCQSGEFFQTVSVVRRSTTQSLRRTQGLTITTSQISMSTSQTSQSTSQTTATTSNTTQQTRQRLASTQQTTRSTRQEFKTTTYTGRSTRIVEQTTTQNLQATSYTERSRTTRQQQTLQTLQSQTQTTRSTTQQRQSTSQILASTSQLRRTDSQVFRTTTQPIRSTSQNLASTTRLFERTSQLMAYNGRTEQSVAVGSCPADADTSCYTLVTGPTAVASCSPQTAAAGNNWLNRSCDAPVVTGPTPVASCSATAASGGNNYTSTSCSTSQSGPSPAASCSPQTASSSNGFLTVTCSSNNTPSTLVASCAAGTDANFVTTSCNTVTGSPTPVGSCTPANASSSNGNTTTSCGTATTTNVPAASCSPSSASSTNGYVATNCNTMTTGPTGVASCSASAASSGNNWTATTCATDATGPTLTDSCTGGTSGSFVVTSCSTSTVSPATAVASCTAQPASSANGFTATVCTPNNSAWTTSASCAPIAASSSNSFTTTQCRNLQTQAPTRVTSCTAGTSGAVTTICNTTNIPATPVASCTPSSGTTVVTCSTNNTGPTRVASCTPSSPTAGNGYTTTTCNTSNGTESPVASCTPVAPGPGNNYQETVCTPYTSTVAVPPGSCVAQSPNALNGYQTVSCPTATVTGPTPVAAGTCSNAAATSGNQYTATSCNTTSTGPTPVASCTPGTATDQTVTTCSNNNSAVTPVAAGSCTNVPAGNGNAYTATVCTNNSSTAGVQAGSCTPVSPTVLNGYKTVSCGQVNTGPTFVADGSCTPGTDANFTTTACSTTRTGPAFVAACTPGTDANFMVTSCSTNTNGPTAIDPGASCTNAAPSASNNFTSTSCVASDTTTGVSAGTCSPSAAGVKPVVTCSTASTASTPVAACTPGTDSNFLTTTCTPETSTPERVSSCSNVSPTAGNGYQTTTCSPITGQKVQTKTRTITTTYTVSGATTLDNTAASDPPQDTGWTDAPGSMCYVAPASPPVVDTTPDWHQSTTGMPSGCSAWPCLGSVDTSTALAGSINSLADVAQYYYVTDLRPNPDGATPDPWKNDVPRLGSGAEDDRAPWQHMTTFVLGLGVSGSREYRPDYKSATSGDFSKIRSYENTPALNWPVWPTSATMSPLAYNDPRSIDDFWHTAVNGRGKFFSAKDPDSVVQGLRDALAGIEGQAGAGAGAATSSLTPIAGDNQAYTGSFVTSEWTGDLQAQDINLTTGNLQTSVQWSARALLDQSVGDACDSRKIFTRNPANGAMVDFTWNTKKCGTGASAGLPQGSAQTGLPSSLQTYFNSASTLSALSQYPLMTDGSSNTADQQSAVRGANLVNYLRGQRGNEGFVSNVAGKLYRTRSHVLGDIVNSQPNFVKAPSLSYQDAGYDAFKTANAARTPMVYVGANDGMLHAFYAPSKTNDPNFAKAGQEAWAFVPNAVIANLWKLADTNYGDRHMFFVDGSPISGDVRDTASNSWKTIVVGGLGLGGKGYYALDVTDPVSPKVLWEFNQAACSGNPVGATSDCNLGYSFGRPVITKLKNGKWVVMVTSGYNNVTAGGNGRGFLFVLDAITGQIISRIDTGAGTIGTPSGLKEINFFVNDVAYDNTAQRAYGADVLGNVWRFDINDVIAPAGKEATLLGTAKDGSGNPQPITTRPELAEVSGSTMVLVATGKMLATADLTDTSQQSVYAIKDPLSGTSPTYANLRTSLKRMRMTQTGSGASATRQIACDGATVTDCSGSNGWYIDLPDGGERVNVDMQTVLGTLVFASNVPSNTLCAAGGYSWLNYVNLINGEAVATSEGSVVSVPFFDNSVVVGLGLVGLPDGTVRALGRDATGATRTLRVPVGSPPPLGKRISWREIVQ